MKKDRNKKKINWNKVLAVILGVITIAVVITCIVLCKTISEDTMSNFEIISLSLSAYSSLSLVLLVIQLIVSKQDAKARHDEKRREKTVDYMIKWSESLSWETSYALRIVESFNHQQCISLYKNIPFEVDYKTKESLCPICSRYLKNTCNDCLKKKKQKEQCGDVTIENNSTSSAKETKEKLYTIDVTQCAEIRWYIIKYLNHLEALLISWKEGIVDREIIEEQFCYLYNPISGTDTLQSFRNIAGDGKSYPTIEEFCLELRNNRQQTNNKLKELL